MTTIRDIATAAGVSIGTVSNYLNDPKLVAEDTRLKIATKIKELDYHPSAAARSLKSRQTFRIGLVPIISSEEMHSSEPGDNAFLELLAGLNTIAAENGYDILISGATNNAQELKTYERLIGENQVDGLVIMGIRSQDERLQFLTDKKFPFVAYGRSNIDIEYPYVDVDGAAGMAMAIQYLVELGHKQIAYITPPEGLMCTYQRWEGFVHGMEENNLPINKDYVIEGGFNQRGGQISTHLLMDLRDPPTAIIAANDVCAFGSMRALQMRGKQVGKDVSVIGFDDISLADHWQPSLTTIAQPFRKIGFSLMQSLFSVISGENQLPQSMVEPNLIVRQSTGVLNKA
ncbi:MAG: LacI family transcriptional regulator [Anaerolineaceae bacterium]|nr:LacI family transcriptional regulator [Anaerolineaceae bacterium]NTV36022.1 LacI family transcriptional regulator [Anaerolineaceae bacterium]